MLGYHVNMIDQNSNPQTLANLELFHRAYRAFTSRADGILEGRGLARSHHRILYFVGRNPQVTINTLLGILGVSKQALNEPLRQLIERGLISAEVAVHDRRVRQLSLTESGRQLEGELTATQVQQLEAAFAAVGIKATAGWLAVMQEFSPPGAV